MNTAMNAPRLRWIALALSFLSAGLGHIYCGRAGKGLILFSAWLLIPVLAFFAALWEPSTAILMGLILAPAVGIVAIYLYAAVDTFVMAGRIGAEYTLKDYNRGLVYGLLASIGLIYPIGTTAIVREFALEAFKVAADSMNPSVLRGDRVLVNKLARRSAHPQRGDVVAFRNPGSGAQVFLKRVIAVPGDAVEMDEGDVIVNGSPLSRERMPHEAAVDTHLPGTVYYETNAGERYRVMLQDESELSEDVRVHRHHAATKVPAHCVFVLGDNRDRSQDSRNFGCVPVADVVGYVQYVFWPADTWSRFGVFRD